MHADQVDVTADVVAALVASQFPQWRGYPVRPLTSDGTVNALFRLGDDIVLRLPLQPDLGAAAREALVQEQDIARRIAARVQLQVPQPLALGEPGEGYSGPWTAYRWIPGETARAENIDDVVTFARDLASFVQAVQGMETGGHGWDGRGRGGPLHALDDAVGEALAQSTHLVDAPRIAEAWARCRQAPVHRGADVYIHADLMPGNLLVRDGRLAAVIDLGATGVGDPAVDLMPAWNVLTGVARTAYREALQVDDATWERGRGWAIVQAIVALPYYVDTNPVMAAIARRTLLAVLD
jgi:aminoglycoside phosphotransferase (APT) family kinase protein